MYNRCDATRICHSYIVPQTRRRVCCIYLEALAYVHATNLKKKLPDLSGSGRVDMITRPVVAARAAVATGALG